MFRGAHRAATVQTDHTVATANAVIQHSALHRPPMVPF